MQMNEYGDRRYYASPVKIPSPRHLTVDAKNRLRESPKYNRPRRAIPLFTLPPNVEEEKELTGLLDHEYKGWTVDDQRLEISADSPPEIPLTVREDARICTDSEAFSKAKKIHANLRSHGIRIGSTPKIKDVAPVVKKPIEFQAKNRTMYFCLEDTVLRKGRNMNASTCGVVRKDQKISIVDRLGPWLKTETGAWVNFRNFKGKIILRPVENGGQIVKKKTFPHRIGRANEKSDKTEEKMVRGKRKFTSELNAKEMKSKKKNGQNYSVYDIILMSREPNLGESNILRSIAPSKTIVSTTGNQHQPFNRIQEFPEAHEPVVTDFHDEIEAYGRSMKPPAQLQTTCRPSKFGRFKATAQIGLSGLVVCYGDTKRAAIDAALKKLKSRLKEINC